MSKEPIFAVFIEHKIHHAGDERSQTNPGHGYPAYTEDISVVKTFPSEKDFRIWVEDNEKGYGKKNYKAFKCFPINISTSINIEYD